MLEPHSLIVVILIGLVAGWLAAKVVEGSGLGIIGDIIVGIIGAYIGRWLLISNLHVHVPAAPSPGTSSRRRSAPSSCCC